MCATAAACPHARAAATAAGAPAASLAAACAANAAVLQAVIGRTPSSHARSAVMAARGRSSPGQCFSKIETTRSAHPAAHRAIARWTTGSGLAHFSFATSLTTRVSQQQATVIGLAHSWIRISCFLRIQVRFDHCHYESFRASVSVGWQTAGRAGAVGCSRRGELGRRRSGKSGLCRRRPAAQLVSVR